MRPDVYRLALGADGQMRAASDYAELGAINRHMRQVHEGHNTNTYFVRRHGECFTAGVFEAIDLLSPVFAAEIICERLDPAAGPEGLVDVILAAHRGILALVAGEGDPESEVLAYAREHELDDLRGLGTSCVVASVGRDALCFTGVGECSVWTLEDRGARELLVPEILARMPPAELAASPDFDELMRVHGHVVLKLLGVDPECAVRPAQRVALGRPVILASASVADVLARDPPSLEHARRGVEAVIDWLMERAPESGDHDTCVVVLPRE